MAGKMGKRITGRKPNSSTRTSAKTDGASGKEQIDQVSPGVTRNRDKATVQREKKV
jgi:hypothetical protein